MKKAIILIANISVILSSIAEYKPDWWESLEVKPNTANGEYNPDWWKSLVITPTPTNDYEQAAYVLRRQGGIVGFLRGADYYASDAIAATNLWNMLAILHGDLREKKIENPPPVFRNFGIITNQVELQRRRAINDDAENIRSYESLRGGLEERIERIFKIASASEALASFPIQERNAIVSNIVELARLTADEAAELGLTNVVETVGE